MTNKPWEIPDSVEESPDCTDKSIRKARNVTYRKVVTWFLPLCLLLVIVAGCASNSHRATPTTKAGGQSSVSSLSDISRQMTDLETAVGSMLATQNQQGQSLKSMSTQLSTIQDQLKSIQQQLTAIQGKLK